jgi:hypothetical protein
LTIVRAALYRRGCSKPVPIICDETAKMVNVSCWKKAVPPAARIEQTVTVGVPIAAVCCERTRLQLRPFLHWCVCPKESMAPGGRLNIGEALGALP